MGKPVLNGLRDAASAHATGPQAGNLPWNDLPGLFGDDFEFNPAEPSGAGIQTAFEASNIAREVLNNLWAFGDDSAPDEDDGVFGEIAAAKPQRVTDSQVERSGNKGKGRTKDKTDTGETDPDVTPTPAPDPVPEPSEPETNPGTTDPNVYVSGLDNPEGFNVEIVFNGTWLDSAKQAFQSAAELISDIVVGDVPNFLGIDDIRVQAYVRDIDGPGTTLGYGGWIQLRSDELRLVAEGGVAIDAADVDSMLGKGSLDEVAFHEILHAMGFGTTWSQTGLTAEIGGATRFIGENAIAAYNSIYKSVAEDDPYSQLGVPLHSDDAHWDWHEIGPEIMSQYVGPDYPVSDMTLAALEDMGYETILEGGDLIA